MTTNPDRPTVPEVLRLVQAYYRKEPVGGCLHVVLDDGNLEDRNIQFCLAEAQREGDAEAVQIAELMLRMTRTQRTKIYKLAHQRPKTP